MTGWRTSSGSAKENSIARRPGREEQRVGAVVSGVGGEVKLQRASRAERGTWRTRRGFEIAVGCDQRCGACASASSELKSWQAFLVPLDLAFAFRSVSHLRALIDAFRGGAERATSSPLAKAPPTTRCTDSAEGFQCSMYWRKALCEQAR